MRVNASVLVDSLGWALLHSLWQITLVAALVYVALRIIPRYNAQLRFVAAYGGLAATFLLFIVTWVLCYRTIGPVESVAMANAVPVEGWYAVIDTLGRATWLVSLIWGLGFSWLGVRYAQALRATARLKHEGTGPVPTDWEMRFRLWVERLGADPRAMILQSSRITTPLTIGTLKPIVLVPTGFFLRLPIDQAEAILIHEIAHICRQDYLLGLIQALVCNIFFFHPAIAYLSRQIDIEREYACDARVVEETGNSNALAQGLGKVALESRDLLPGFAMAADGGATPLMDRITRLRERSFRRESGATTPVAALTLVLAGCLTIAASADATFSSGASKDRETKGGSADIAEPYEAEPVFDIALADTPEPHALSTSALHEVRSAHRSEPKSHGTTPEDRWSRADQDGWSFNDEPGWTTAFRGSGSNSQKSENSSFRPVAFEQDSGLLRNAILQTGLFEPNAAFETRIEANSDECEDKDQAIADRREARFDRDQAQRDAQLDREIAQIDAEMERVEQQMERIDEVHEVDIEREMAQLSAQMTALSSQMEARMEQHVERARAVTERARSRSERSARRHRRSAPSVAPEPPAPPQPVITISFNIEMPSSMVTPAHAVTPVTFATG
jgi:beta-lactamase regulating signal transducer with metallopeptidase domain